MREPTLRARLMAWPPVVIGSWGLAAWLLYQWSQHGDAWPVAIGSCFWVAAVMKAEEQVRVYKAWKREWDAMAGAPPPPRRWPQMVGFVLGLPLIGLFVHAGQHGGSQVVIVLAIVLAVPLVLLALLAKLWRAWRRRRSEKASKSVPVAVCVSRALIPVPSLQDAYRGLPDHCRAIMRSMP